MRVRSRATLGVFGIAAIVALIFPVVGLLLCVACLVFYLRPEPTGAYAGLFTARKRSVSRPALSGKSKAD